MSKLPSISIITVCYNSENTLEKTILSVKEQDYPDIEYIVIDGASSDGTQAILKKYQHQIHCLISEPDNGIYDAMNKGIRCATKEVVGILNSDDVFAHSQVVSTIAKAFFESECEACYGDLIYFKAHAPDKVYRYWRSSPFVPGAFAKGWSPPHPTFFVRRSIYEHYGNFNTSYVMGNDIELLMRFLEKYRIKSKYLPEVLVKMRMGGVSNQGFKNIIEQNRNILRAARALNIPISPFCFVIYKLLNRLSQLISPKITTLKLRSESS